MRQSAPTALVLLAIGCGTVRAADLSTPPPAADKGPWSSTGKASLQLSSVSSGNGDTSHDPAINGTTNSTAFTASFDGTLLWRREPDSVEQILKAQYGRARTADDPSVENADELRYDGIYRRTLAKPHYGYLGWGGDTVFTGPKPEEHHFDPLTGRLSSGYGQLYEDFLPEKSRFDGRLGVRAQKRWGDSLKDSERDLQVGPEAFLRYEQTAWQDASRLLRWFTQYEAFSEFEDLAHVSNLVTAGLTAQVARYVTIDVGVRAYYETAPKEANGSPGYNQWSMRQETLVGLTYLW